VPFKTSAFEAADAMGWSIAELSRRSGVPVHTLYEIRRGRRSVGSKTMPGLRQAFPQLSFEQLFSFVPADSASLDKGCMVAERYRQASRG
jgi:transcriptional regulator with XRE-family HTH domain